MSFQGINFANQRLLPSDDGRLYQNIFNDGALYGCGITYSGTELTIAQGHLVIGGRQIEIESAEVLNVNQAVSGFAQIVIAIDLTKTATISTFNQISIEVRYAAAEDGFSTLTQTDINGTGSYYEAQLALLSLGTGGITGIVQNMPQAAFKGAAEGGDGGLNLKVVGGTTQPTSPKENTIWVNTDTEITGYAFSADEPASPAEGMVWFKIGTTSSVAMNIDKKNTVMLYPGGCSQYIGGAWVEKDAQTYLNGEWVDWRIYFYNKGDQCLELTGGWLAKGILANSSGSGNKKTPVVTQNADNMTIVFNASQYGCGVVYTQNQIDLTELKTITINGSADCPVTRSSVTVRAYSNIPSYRGESAVASANIKTGGVILQGVFETTLDVSALSGIYYLGIDFYNDPGGTNTVIVEEFYGVG